MKRLAWELKQLARRNRDGSYATQKARRHHLELFARQLDELGYRNMNSHSLRQKHVDALVNRWKDERSSRTGDKITAATMANRLITLRWWADKIGKPGVVKSKNSDYGVRKDYERFSTNKAKELLPEHLAQIGDPFIRLSLQLQVHFGLRREEAMKIQPSVADQGDCLYLKASWTKGGRPRTIPVTTEIQREVLDEAKRIAKGGSLIPPNLLYKQRLKRFEHQTRAAGIGHSHGLRHRFAQETYAALTGWPCPAAGGAKRKSLTEKQRELDVKARHQITTWMGHGRIRVLNAYLGR